MSDIDKKLDEILGALVNQVEWCVNPAAGAVSVNREKEQAAQSTSKAQLRTLIEQQKLEARIDEVEKAVSNFRWGQGTDDLTDRLAELKQKGK